MSGLYFDNRPGLERLLGYCSRPALLLKRLVYAAKSKVVLYRAERHDGRPGMLAMSPVEFLRRWGLLLPPPRKNLAHYYGALAPRSPLRPALTAQAVKEVRRVEKEERAEKLKNRVRSWAACLARVFEVSPLVCPKCRIDLKPVAVILDDKELVRLLNHFGLPAGRVWRLSPNSNSCLRMVFVAGPARRSWRLSVSARSSISSFV
ncbi:MAG: transposase Tn3 family protein [Elusimicrobia bacterium]|nr:MAG: transposase Tn3 family protein [Elusimicrobiota bacterium]